MPSVAHGRNCVLAISERRIESHRREGTRRWTSRSRYEMTRFWLARGLPVLVSCCRSCVPIEDPSRIPGTPTWPRLTSPKAKQVLRSPRRYGGRNTRRFTDKSSHESEQLESQPQTTDCTLNLSHRLTTEKVAGRLPSATPTPRRHRTVLLVLHISRKRGH